MDRRGGNAKKSRKKDIEGSVQKGLTGAIIGERGADKGSGVPGFGAFRSLKDERCRHILRGA
ncbi:hypothetical protein STRDD11_01494 [Streptococcus sp. DD11]|nr:hypothetical protein STRDD11_01494 [Streptococcus sp. DD11]